ncbi:L,D-transpeptidase [Neisseria weaveri]|uniref:Periplasmic protein n=1 Tax=Neisseria weaveri TaxID=28091 RepID=A0A448VMQ0_9NEIS|nr:L,D-transpeptidase [Neisseria weaveri]EGV35632.1 periplasmic protein [Neisseria weaveri ATCC 51223]EGV38325.1 periplasmic protein [Neisseria weaveri LMG 5135]SAY51706.1 Periplasmic protein [Neisseria weaveri]VEJ51036.1 Periplasmic protein [Neisseria weaveri]
MKKTAYFMLLSLSFQAQAFDLVERPAVIVDTQKAELCFPDIQTCHPALVGPTTPKGRYNLELVRTPHRGYGGDVIKFKEEPQFIFAIHRVWTLKPSEKRMERIASGNPSDRNMTNGCINVTDEVYEQVKLYSTVEIR